MIMVTIRNISRIAVTLQLEAEHTGIVPHLSGTRVKRRTYVKDQASGDIRPKDVVFVAPPSVTIAAGDVSPELPESVLKLKQVASLLRNRSLTVINQTK